MAHNEEPMEIDNIESDFDNKENSFHHSNVYPRTPCTEKGYEELDVSELNMKLRYSGTPASSPMSKSYTANCVDNKVHEPGDEIVNTNLTRSFNSTINKNDILNKSVKTLPLQELMSEQLVDNNRNATVLRPLDKTVVADINNVTVTVTETNDIDENISFPSSSSSSTHTPEATTPTKDIPRSDGGSPIMRGLKSVLNMFRSSQSPIPPTELDNTTQKQVLCPAETSNDISVKTSPTALSSTPIVAHRRRETSLPKKSSPHGESVVFNEDLEKELLWKDETTILFSEEKIPIHKLFPTAAVSKMSQLEKSKADLDSTVEYMDVSYNDSIVKEKTMTDVQAGRLNVAESDSEFVDCETTFTEDKVSTDKKESKTDVTVNEKEECLDITNTISSISLQTSEESQLIADGKDLDADLQKPCNSTQTLGNEIKSGSQIVSATESISIDSQMPTTMPDTKHEDFSQVIEETIEVDAPQIPISESDLKPQISEAQNIIEHEVNVVGENKTVSEDNINKSVTKLTMDPVVLLNEVTSNLIISDEPTVNQESINDSIIKPSVVENSTESNQDVTDLQIKLCDLKSSIEPTILQNNDKVCSELESTVSIDQNPMDKTCVKENYDFQIPNNTVDISAAVSILNDNLNLPDIVQNTAFDGNVSNSKNNMYLQNDVLKITDSPADIPLPDEDDIENNKSLGACIIEKHATIPFDINNMSIDANLKSLDCIEQMPNETMNAAKFSNENTIIDNSPNKEISTTNEVQNNIETKQVTDFTLTCKGDQLITDIDKVSSEIQIDDASIKKEEQIIVDINRTNMNTPAFSHIQETISIKELYICQQGDAVPQMDDTTTKYNNAEEMKQNLDVKQNIEMQDISVKTLPLDSKDQQEMSVETIENKFDELEIETQIITKQNVQQSLVNTKNEEISKIVDKNTELEPKSCEPLNNEIKMIAAIENNPDNTYMGSDLVETSKNQSDRGGVIEIIAIEEPVSGVKGVTNAVTGSFLDIETTNHQLNELSKQAINDDLISPVIERQSTFEEISNEQHIVNKDEVENNIDEHIIISENSSPYVSVAGGIDPVSEQPINYEEIDNPFATKSKVPVSPPLSPKIVSKGYNFNFDEIDDPFATKTKIRMSPTPGSPEVCCSEKLVEKPVYKEINKNRRKSQPERKKVVPKKKLNSTFSGVANLAERKPTDLQATNKQLPSCVESYASDNTSDMNKSQNVNFADIQTELKEEPVKGHQINEIENKSCENDAHNLTSEIKNAEKSDTIIENKLLTESIVTSCEEKTTSSEQSTYFSSDVSLSGSTKTRIVFNIPEIDDINFNPFATKTKIRQSPPPSLEDTFNMKSDNSDGKITAPLEDNANLSDTTTSSKATDERDETVREVNTEDEDTIEGPFLEAEDLNNDNKISDFDGDCVDMMQFSELPTQTNEDGGELFIDAEAFEFLLNQNKTNVVADSGKESLFLKFDPLFAKRVSTDGVLAALKKVQKRQSTPKKMSTAQQINHTFEKSMAGPSTSTASETQEIDSNITAEESAEDLNVTVSKPMMVVTPAVNPVVTPRNKATTPTSSNRRSITFTSPAIAVIDRLLSLSGNNSMLGHDTTVMQSSREQNEAELALTQLRELLAEKEINVYNLRTESKELKDKLSNMESQMRALEAEAEERLKKINELNDKLTEKTKLNKSMAAVVEEYERTIASLIAEKEQDKKRHSEERMKLIRERDEQTAHLASMEVSFSDLHSKYEKSKQIILTCKANEDTYKKSIKEFEDNLAKMQSNYELLKQHATTKLNHANQELEKMNRTHEAEVLKLNAMIKRKELHITSLEETLAQKTKANDELTAICDELINKVG